MTDPQNPDGHAVASRRQWAAALALEVDRLALCIHHPTGRRPELMAALGSLGLPPLSFVVSAARLVAAGRVTADDLGLLGRYEPRSWAEVSIRQHVDRGLLVADPSGGGYVPSDTFRDGARLVLDLQAEEASQLWEVDRAVLCAVLELTAAAVGMAAQSAQELPAFRQQVSTHHVLGSSPAGQLLGHMTELRYLRSDVHATALAEAGLAGPSARALHRLWRGFGPAPDQAPWQADLEGRGLIRADAEGWAATAEGVRILDEVEAATNSSFSSVLADLPERDRFTFLELARRLDGVDPRPIEDR